MSPDVRHLNPGLELTGTVKKNKYNATRTERLWKGILWKFDSRAEARRFDALTAMQEAGEVQFFLVQVPFRLPETTYRVDFVVWWKDGHVTFEDVFQSSPNPEAGRYCTLSNLLKHKRLRHRFRGPSQMESGKLVICQNGDA